VFQDVYAVFDAADPSHEIVKQIRSTSLFINDTVPEIMGQLATSFPDVYVFEDEDVAAVQGALRQAARQNLNNSQTRVLLIDVLQGWWCF
jgi:predicted fused transcriptional regulator/phosphomethylpyrimidine kinase